MTDAGKERDKELGVGQQVAFLRNISFFHDFDDHELKQFLAVSKWLKVPKGALIIKEGTTERAFYILVKGEAQVTKAGRSGKPVVLTTLKAGDCFGEMAMVTEIKRTADVVVSRDAFALRVEPEIVSTSSVFLQLKFYKRFCEILVARLDIANRRMADDEPEAAAAPAQSPSRLHEKPAKTGGREKVGKSAGGRTKALAARAPDLPPMPGPEEKLTSSKVQQRIKSEQLRGINPGVVRELERLLNSGDATTNTRAFAELITLDPVLSCKVIQTANSPIYRRATPVSTVPHAMIIIGITSMREIVAGFLEQSQGAALFGGFGEIARNFWLHSVAVAHTADLLEETIRLASPVDIHMAGLLHDLGMLPLDGVMPGFYPQLCRTPPPFDDLIKAERDYVGADHCRAGLWLGEQLGLPQAYLDVMQYHHMPERATANLLPVALVTLANLFVKERGVCVGRSGVGEEDVRRSFGWVLLQEQHKPFLDVNIQHFIESFRGELDKEWPVIVGNLPQ